MNTNSSDTGILEAPARLDAELERYGNGVDLWRAIDAVDAAIDAVRVFANDDDLGLLVTLRERLTAGLVPDGRVTVYRPRRPLGSPIPPWQL